VVDAVGAEVDASVVDVATAADEDAFDVPSTVANALVSATDTAGVATAVEVTCG
jgi:hypothetical protein